MASGNRTGCGNQPETMCKISSEGKQMLQMDKDLGNSLEMIRLKLKDKESSHAVPPSASHNGFVHTIGMYPPLLFICGQKIRLDCGMVDARMIFHIWMQLEH